MIDGCSCDFRTASLHLPKSGAVLHMTVTDRANGGLAIKTPLFFGWGAGNFAGPLVPVRAEAIKTYFRASVLREKGTKGDRVALSYGVAAKWMEGVEGPAE